MVSEVTESIILRFPEFKTVYQSINTMVNTIINCQHTNFMKAVLTREIWTHKT
ncbi:MAG: DUF502 domain-containing protein [Bacteroidales bacterium]|nr:DUF502 domain-containing protein [Bacteroidales bacterium]